MKKIEDDVAIPLIARYRLGDRKAGDELLRMFETIVMHHANLSQRLRYRIEFDDSVQAARLGILYAAENFDVDQGMLFRSFAYQCAKWWIYREIRATAFIVRPGGSIAQVMRAYSDANGDIDAAASKLRLKRSTAKEALAIIASNGGYSELDIGMHDAFSIENSIGKADELEAVRSIVLEECGDGRGIDIAERILGEVGLSYEELGKRWGCSREWARQTEKKVMKRIETRIREELAA